MDANTIEQTRLRAEQTRLRADLNPNAEYYRYFYAYYRQTPEVRDVIDRFIVNDSQKKGEQLMQTSLNFPPFNGKQQPTNYTPEQQQEADTAAQAALIRQTPDENLFSAIPSGHSGGKRKLKKSRYNKKSKTNKKCGSQSNKRQQYRSNKRSRKYRK